MFTTPQEIRDHAKRVLSHKALVKLGLVNPAAEYDSKHGEVSMSNMDPKAHEVDVAEPDGDHDDQGPQPLSDMDLDKVWEYGFERGEGYREYPRSVPGSGSEPTKMANDKQWLDTGTVVESMGDTTPHTELGLNKHPLVRKQSLMQGDNAGGMRYKDKDGHVIHLQKSGDKYRGVRTSSWGGTTKGEWHSNPHVALDSIHQKIKSNDNDHLNSLHEGKDYHAVFYRAPSGKWHKHAELSSEREAEEEAKKLRKSGKRAVVAPPRLTSGEISSWVARSRSRLSEEAMMETAPPGMEDWITSNKPRFTKEYGKKKGTEILFGKAWSMYNKKKKLHEAMTGSMESRFEDFKKSLLGE